MNHAFKVFLATALSALAVPALAALNVFACEPEWAALAGELGGDKVNVYAATTALQDAHHIEARPSLIARARNADLMICSGSELEIGWVPLLLTQAGNSRIQPGSPGYLEASQLVERIEIPRVVDRSLGDTHPAGGASRPSIVRISASNSTCQDIDAPRPEATMPSDSWTARRPGRSERCRGESSDHPIA